MKNIKCAVETSYIIINWTFSAASAEWLLFVLQQDKQSKDFVKVKQWEKDTQMKYEAERETSGMCVEFLWDFFCHRLCDSTVTGVEWILHTFLSLPVWMFLSLKGIAI